MRRLLLTRELITVHDCMSSTVHLRHIALTRTNLYCNVGTYSTILPPPPDSFSGSESNGPCESQSSQWPSHSKGGGGHYGAAANPSVWPVPGGDVPFKLYGEDTRVYVNAANRVFSTAAQTSYDPAAFVDEARALAREAAAAVSETVTNAPQGGGSPPDFRQFLPTDGQEERVAVVSVAAAAVAMSADAKKPDVAISTHSPPQEPPKTDAVAVPPHIVFARTVKSTKAEALASPVAASVSSSSASASSAAPNENLKASPDGSDSADGDAPAADSNGIHVLVRDHMRCLVKVEPLQSFASLAPRLPPWLARSLDAAGFVAPTAVQSVAMPLFFERRDVTCVAPTGSGKTVAFAVPALAAAARALSEAPIPQTIPQTIPKNIPQTIAQTIPTDHPVIPTAALAYPRALVLCPTRELVHQTFGVFASLANNALRVECLFGGQERERQLDTLRARGGCDLLVSTPGRLCDFAESGAVSLRAVEFLVLDEADRMLELGFAPQLEYIVAAMRGSTRARQTSMWTATWSATVGALAARFMRVERLLIEVDGARSRTNANIAQRLYAVADPTQRIAAIARLYESGVILKREQVLFFVNRQSTAEELATELCRALRAPPDLVQALHGRMKQRRRDAIVRGFRDGGIRILCATDIAARGLDVPAIAHVVNYELPALTDVYVHRVGRTGRAGRAGTAHTFIVGGDARAPRIARFVAAHSGEPLSDDVLDIVKAIELRGPVGTPEPERERFRSHARVAGRDWRAPAHVDPTRERSSRYVRGVGRVMTLARPHREEEKGPTHSEG